MKKIIIVTLVVILNLSLIGITGARDISKFDGYTAGPTIPQQITPDGINPIIKKQKEELRIEDIDFETECQSRTLADSDIAGLTGLVDKITELISEQNENYKLGNKYLFCFQENLSKNIKVNNIIPSYDNNVIIYGLKANFSASFSPDVKIELSGNISLKNVEFIGESTNPLTIKGSDVKVIDSIIKTNEIGIKIGEPNTERVSNVLIKNSSIHGPSLYTLDSVGINIVNAENVRIYDNIGTISNFQTAIKYRNSENIVVLNNEYKYVGQFVDGKNDKIIDWEQIGKAFIEISGHEIVWRIAGLVPSIDSEDVCDSRDVIELYEVLPGNVFKPVGKCPIMEIMNGDHLVLCNTDADIDSKEALSESLEKGECVEYGVGSCIFDCLGLEMPINDSIEFTYTDVISIDESKDEVTQGETFSDSEPRVLLGLKNISEIATYAPGVDTSTPNMEGDGGGDDGPSLGAGGGDVSGVNVGDVEVDGGAPLSSGMGPKAGCSLTSEASVNMNAIAILALLSTLIGGLKIVLVKRKNKK